MDRSAISCRSESGVFFTFALAVRALQWRDGDGGPVPLIAGPFPGFHFRLPSWSPKRGTMHLYKQPLLSRVQLERLAKHRYSCQSISLLDGLLQPWWCWLVSKLPLWLAPNLITCVGLAVNVITTLLLVWYVSVKVAS